MRRKLSGAVWMLVGCLVGVGLASSAEAAVVVAGSVVARPTPVVVQAGPVTHVGATVVRTTPCRPGVKVGHVGRTVVR